MSKTHRVKMFAASLRYRFRTLLRRTSVLSWLVLGVALYLSLALVVPLLQAPLRTIGLEFPALARYELTGTVTAAGTMVPLSAVQVSVGGYSTTTDADGRYALRFPAASSQDICVVLRVPNTTVVRYVDAGPDSAVILNEEIQ